MADDPPPLAPDDARAPPIGARVMVAAELRQHGKESHLVRIESGHGLWQYVWVNPALIVPAG